VITISLNWTQIVILLVIWLVVTPIGHMIGEDVSDRRRQRRMWKEIDKDKETQ
jgi:hypothetical protein